MKITDVLYTYRNGNTKLFVDIDFVGIVELPILYHGCILVENALKNTHWELMDDSENDFICVSPNKKLLDVVELSVLNGKFVLKFTKTMLEQYEILLGTVGNEVIYPHDIVHYWHDRDWPIIACGVKSTIYGVELVGTYAWETEPVLKTFRFFQLRLNK